MPGHPDPRVNLGIVMEMAGRTEDALGAYASALEVRSEYMPAVQGMARLLVRSGRDEGRLGPLLEQVASNADDAAWRQWARSELARRR